ncbi:MAG: ABC transporter ATP-binding protein [Brevinema sp.]
MFLETKSLVKVYDNGTVPFRALDQVSISMNAGRIGALVGASGSGKTTLLNIIGALDTATEGEVHIDGESLMGKDENALSLFRREYLGFIFQSYNLIPVLTAYENVALALFNVPENKKKDHVMPLLERVGLKGKENNLPGQLSGGQQQRVSIARALVKTPKLLLADEPTANLDSNTGQTILQLMAEINKESGITILFSTHDQRVMDVAHDVFHVIDGKVDGK